MTPGVSTENGAKSGQAPWLQVAGYCAVSLVALGLDMALFLLLTTRIGAVLAAIASYAAGLVLHFLLSAGYVFDASQTGKARARLFTEYSLSGLAGLLLTAATVAVTVDIAGLAPAQGKGVAVAVSFITVFLIRRSIVFAARPA